jgi:hypothetical protein
MINQHYWDSIDEEKEVAKFWNLSTTNIVDVELPEELKQQESKQWPTDAKLKERVEASLPLSRRSGCFRQHHPQARQATRHRTPHKRPLAARVSAGEVRGCDSVPNSLGATPLMLIRDLSQVYTSAESTWLNQSRLTLIHRAGCAPMCAVFQMILKYLSRYNCSNSSNRR